MSKSINYQHLYYFWNVVKEGSFTKASKKLGLAQPTISGQILTFEKSIGSSLILRKGRNIDLTETGHIVFNYAQKIFLLGDKMNDDVKYKTYNDQHRLIMGCCSNLPSLIVNKITNFALDQIQNNRLICLIDSSENMLNKLTRNQIDVVISDEPRSYYNGMPIYIEKLIDSQISLLSHSSFVSGYRINVPLLLERIPLILPTPNTRMRFILEEWFTHLQVRPLIICEMESFDHLLNMAINSPYLICAPSILLNDLNKYMHFDEIYRIPNQKIMYYSSTLSKKIEKDLLAHIIKKCQSEYE